MKYTIAISAIVLVLCWCAEAFAPSPTSPRRAVVTFSPARKIAGRRPTNVAKSLLKMSEEKPTAAEGATEGNSESEVAAAPKKGEAFYDDEYDSAPQKSGISDSMRARLMAEASTGLDADKKQANVLLYIMAGVAVLVLLGGQGIFF